MGNREVYPGESETVNFQNFKKYVNFKIGKYVKVDLYRFLVILETTHFPLWNTTYEIRSLFVFIERTKYHIELFVCLSVYRFCTWQAIKTSRGNNRLSMTTAV